MCSIGNLSVSEPSLNLLEKFQCGSDLSKIKCNCVKLFLGQKYSSIIYPLKTIFSSTTIAKALMCFPIKKSHRFPKLFSE